MELSTQSLGPAVRADASSESLEETSVRWIGRKPRWFDIEEARAALHGVEIEWSSTDATGRRKLRVAGAQPDVVHVQSSDLKSLATLRQSLPRAKLVLDLSGDAEGHIGWRSARDAALADVILVGSLWELRELRRRYPAIAGRTILFRRPVDLTMFGSEEPPGITAVMPFREPPAIGQRVLFAGPYTEAGGLDLMLDAMIEVQERQSRVSLAAIPYRTINWRYLARCKRRAERLGERVFFAPTVESGELPFWYEAADVVCLPCREAVGAQPAKLAAAAGKPFLGTEVDPLLEHVVEGQTGFLFPVNDFDTFVAAVEALVSDGEEARRLGASARRRAEHDLSPVAAAERLRWIWTDVLSPRGPGLGSPAR